MTSDIAYVLESFFTQTELKLLYRKLVAFKDQHPGFEAHSIEIHGDERVPIKFELDV